MRIVDRHRFPSVSLSSHNVIIFGEIHTAEERDEIEQLILRCHRSRPFNFLLSEELGSHEVFTNPGKVKAIKNMEWSNSPRSYELGITLNIPVIGIDTWDKTVYEKDVRQGNKILDCSHSFALREARMRQVILECAVKNRRIAVIVGDSHLREHPHKVLGGPSVLTQFHDQDFLLVRSPIKEVL